MVSERHRPKALLIDDEAKPRAETEQQLQTLGHEVHPARSANEALELVRGGLRPSVILVDLFMPGMDAVEFRRRQLGIVELALVPTIVMTETLFQGPVAQSIGVRLLRKPFKLEELREAVQAVRRAEAGSLGARLKTTWT